METDFCAKQMCILEFSTKTNFLVQVFLSRKMEESPITVRINDQQVLAHSYHVSFLDGMNERETTVRGLNYTNGEHDLFGCKKVG